MADLAVIVVSYNSEDWLRGCLESVYAHAGDDRAGRRGRGQWLLRCVRGGRRAGFPPRAGLRSENRGFAHGNNRGFEVTDAPFVLFLNPDTEIRAGTLEHLLEYLRQHPAVGLLGCRQLTGEGTLILTIRRFPSPLRYLMAALGGERLPVHRPWTGERELEAGAYDRETECDWVSGSFMLARRGAVVEAGLMDERYFLYAEEPDMCAGIKSAGWQVRYVPEMTIVHYEGTQALDARRESQRAYSRRQYMFKHEGVVHRSLSVTALALFYVRRSIGWGSGNPEAMARRSAARAALKTIMGVAPPPFGELSGPLRGPRLSTPEASTRT